jgi:flavin reductase (DIM6/NTAB) family NADH-FMN oxidoreductase RutF
MKKESVDIDVMWHIDALIHLFPVTIVTTVDDEGKVNAAPYSLVVPFCSSSKNPLILLIANKNWHTAKNIEKTGVFVLNYPRADQVREINETARHYPKGINELDHTNYTTTPAKHVSPPRIVECYQHIECRVKEIIRPSQTQLNFIAEVLDISLDEGLYEVPRVERAKIVNAPVFLGMDEQQHFIYGKISEIAPIPVKLKVDQ